MKLFLDDIRNPIDCFSYMHSRIGDNNPLYLDKDWVIARNFSEFCRFITQYAELGDNFTHISFDHDLADGHYEVPNTEYIPEQYDNNIESGLYDEKTGYDAAKWLKEYYEVNKLELPVMFVHSMNPIGARNIVNLFVK